MATFLPSIANKSIFLPASLNLATFNSLESTGDNGRQPPLLPPRLRATIVDTRIHNYRLSAAP